MNLIPFLGRISQINCALRPYLLKRPLYPSLLPIIQTFIDIVKHLSSMVSEIAIVFNFLEHDAIESQKN